MELKSKVKKSQTKISIKPMQLPAPSAEKIESRKEDLKLINLALDGDQSAYVRLMKKYKSTINHVLFRVVQDPDEVEDITQEVFINAFKSLKSFKKEYSFFSWIYKIALNKGIDYLRKKKIQTLSLDKPIESEESDYRYEVPDSTYEPDKSIIAKERATFIQQAIDKLPAKYRKVIIMRHQEEKDYGEIAKELKLPIGTVKVHIFRARELLNKYLRNKIGHY
jgi:RNA polymerase sigma factor (sigma-70 family)